MLKCTQAAQAHDAITRNVTRALQPHGGGVLQRFEFINVCMGEKWIRNFFSKKQSVCVPVTFVC